MDIGHAGQRIKKQTACRARLAFAAPAECVQGEGGKLSSVSGTAQCWNSLNEQSGETYEGEREKKNVKPVVSQFKHQQRSYPSSAP